MPAETGLSFLFDTAFRFQPNFHRYVSNYVELLKFDNPYMDETQMSMAQQTLKVEFYRLCLESLGLASFDGLLILDYDGLLLEINGMAEKTLGVKRSAVLGQPFFQKLFPETQKEEYLTWIKKHAKDTGEVFRKSTEVLMVKSSGTMFPAEIKVTELKIFGSALLVICFNDITRRKWMDQALKYTEERYRKIMGENADAICLIDPFNKRIEESNPAFNILLGYSDDELFALRLYDVLEGAPEDIDAWVDKRMRQGTSLLLREQGRFFTRNRIPVDVEYSCSIFDLRDHPLLCIIARDTAPREFVVRRSLADSQIETLETQLGKLGDRLKELEQTKLSKAQQEILSELLGHHELLAKEVEREGSDDDGPLPKRQQRQPFTLKTLLFHVQGLFKEALEAKELPLTISVEPDVPDILIGDPIKLQEVIYHILENAIANTGEGALHITVRVTQTEHSIATLLFAIRDGGNGVPAVAKAKITDVFSSDNPLETGEKYGIRGLTLCAHFIKALDGRIWFNTLEGKGSSFLFSLPLETTEQEADDLPELTLETIRQHLQVVGGQIHDLLATGQTDTPSLEESASGFTIISTEEDAPASQAQTLNRPLRLLLVEQDVDNVIRLQQSVAGQKVEMRMVDNGRKALELVQEQSFDLVLMALDLPIMNGYAAGAAIRNWERDNRRPALLMVALMPENEETPEEQLQDFNRFCPAALTREVVDDLRDWAQNILISSETEEAAPPDNVQPEQQAAPPAPEPAKMDTAALADLDFNDLYDFDPTEPPAPAAVASQTADKSGENGENGGDNGHDAQNTQALQVRLSADMARLAPDFLTKRKQDVQKLRQAIVDNKLDSVRVLGKSMKGTGGVYGFSQIAEIGKEIEAAAGSQSPEDVSHWVEELSDFLERVEIVVE